LASPAPDQRVSRGAVAVVRAHAVDAAAPLAVRRPLTLVDIWRRERKQKIMLECEAREQDYTNWSNSVNLFMLDDPLPD